MIKLELLNDDDLQDVLTRCLSGLLPHENYDQTYFLPIIQMVTKTSARVNAVRLSEK